MCLDIMNVSEDRAPMGGQFFELDGHFRPSTIIIVLPRCQCPRATTKTTPARFGGENKQWLKVDCDEI